MLLAVHISDGVLEPLWWMGAWLPAGLWLGWSAWKIPEEEIPKLGVLTAAFFVASQIHLPLGGVSVHLLLNGLLGVLLTRRCVLAMAVGLLLQALLFGHGGITSLGINLVLYSVPAVVVGYGLPLLRNVPLLKAPAVRFALMTLCCASWLGVALASAQWLSANLQGDPSAIEWWIANPIVLAVLGILSLFAGRWERRLEESPEFPLGFWLGAFAAAGTVGLNAAVLAFGGMSGVRGLAGVTVLANLPLVAVEAVVVGFVVAFLARAKPEWLDGSTAIRETLPRTEPPTDPDPR